MANLVEDNVVRGYWRTVEDEDEDEDNGVRGKWRIVWYEDNVV